MKVKDLRAHEQRKWQVAKEVSDLGCTDVAIRRGRTKLGCTRKTMLKYVQWYQSGDISLFCHKNRGRKPITTIDEEIKTKVMLLYRETYSGASYAHFSEILAEDYNIHLSEGTLHTLLKGALLVSPHARRATKRTIEKELRRRARRENISKAEGEHITAAFNILDQVDAHPRKARSKYFGEVLQMDACEHRWVAGAGKWHLHAAIDDATSEVVGWWFDYQETLNGYYHVLYMILKLYGVPSCFHTDRRTVFEYSKRANPEPEKDTFTQFSAACKTLGISIVACSTPQFKPRIERLNRTLQGRLPVEFIRNNITTMEEANAFLWEYLPVFNAQFSLKDEKDEQSSTFLESPPESEINAILAVVMPRVIDAGHAILYYRTYYMPHQEKRGALSAVYYPKGTSALVIKAFDGSLLASIRGQIHILVEIEKRKTHSKEFDPGPAPKKRIPHKPGPDHPWRSSYFTPSILQSHIAKPKDGYLE
jgi:hypothetical protein